VTDSTWPRQRTQIRQWVAAHPWLITTSASIALGALTALYGSVGRWAFLKFALPQGWAVGAITLTALMPDRLRGTRQARIARWLLWSSLPALCLQQVAYVLDHQRWDAVVLSGWLTLLIGLELAALTPVGLRNALHELPPVLRRPDYLVPAVVACFRLR
jgi:hypothetical protein